MKMVSLDAQMNDAKRGSSRGLRERLATCVVGVRAPQRCDPGDGSERDVHGMVRIVLLPPHMGLARAEAPWRSPGPRAATTPGLEVELCLDMSFSIASH